MTEIKSAEVARDRFSNATAVRLGGRFVRAAVLRLLVLLCLFSSLAYREAPAYADDLEEAWNASIRLADEWRRANGETRLFYVDVDVRTLPGYGTRAFTNDQMRTALQRESGVRGWMPAQSVPHELPIPNRPYMVRVFVLSQAQHNDTGFLRWLVHEHDVPLGNTIRGGTAYATEVANDAFHCSGASRVAWRPGGPRYLLGPGSGDLPFELNRELHAERYLRDARAARLLTPSPTTTSTPFFRRMGGAAVEHGPGIAAAGVPIIYGFVPESTRNDLTYRSNDPFVSNLCPLLDLTQGLGNLGNVDALNRFNYATGRMSLEERRRFEGRERQPEGMAVTPRSFSEMRPEPFVEAYPGGPSVQLQRHWDNLDRIEREARMRRVRANAAPTEYIWLRALWPGNWR